MRRAGDPAHWSERARSVADDAEVNCADVHQRELEYEAIEPWLEPGWRLLEVGCGNGHSTEWLRRRVAHVDAIDCAEAMIERARTRVGERNNRFLCDDILEPKSLDDSYDAVVCVRVLINLGGFAEQVRAIESIGELLRPDSNLILTEGFSDGFDQLSALRREVGLSPLEPAPINFYSALGELWPELESRFELSASFHLGAYDYLTRVLYPLLAGEHDVRHNTVISERSAELARAFNPPDFEHLSRIRGFLLRRRG